MDAKVGGLDRQLAGVQRDVDAAEARLEVVQSEFVQTQTQLSVTRGQLAAARGELRDRAVAAYLGTSEPSAAEILLKAKDVHELTAGVGYLESVVKIQKEAVRRHSDLRDATELLQGSAEIRKDAAKAQRDEVVSRRSALEAVRWELDAARQEVVAEEGRQQQLVDEAKGRVSEFEAQIAALQGESDVVTGLLRGLQAGQMPSGAGAGVLASPVASPSLNSFFGPRVHPILGTSRMHNGVDFRAGTGTPILAAANGMVAYAGPRGGYGNTTVVDHGGSIATLYAHQSAIYVTAGTAVTKGQVIGAVGSTGMSTGPHLHFEVRVGGTPVDPVPYLRPPLPAREAPRRVTPG